MFRTACAAAAVVAAALAMVVGPADAQPRQIQVGTLTCSMSASVGLIVGSQKNVSCVLKGQPGEPEEAYSGTMTTIGLDIGVTTGGAIIWAVFSDTNRYAGMLAGTYTGATAEVSIAAGLGANVLVGGIEEDGGAAAFVGAGPDWARYRRRDRPVAVASGPLKSGEFRRGRTRRRTRVMTAARGAQ